MDNKSDRVIVVTGSSGGIGGAVVWSLLKDGGYSVIGIDKKTAPEKILAESNYRHFVADVNNEDEIRSVHNEIRSLAPLAHAILVAGGALPEEIRDDKGEEPDPLKLNLDSFRKSVDINLTGQYICVKYLAPLLEAADGIDRSITLVSSINAIGDFGYPAYSAAKAGLTGLTESLAVPLGRLNIRINAVAFGTVRTAYSTDVHGFDANHFDRLEKLAALGRLSDEDEAARVLVALIRLNNITGTIITADCGQAVPGNHNR